jgi:cytochrome c-type biogenesis protein
MASPGLLAFAISAGVATFFAPCAFPLLPGYVGYYASENERASMIPAAGAATAGALTALAVVTGLVFTIGQPLKAALPVLEPVIGVALVLFGLLTLAGRMPELRLSLPGRTASVAGFGVFGAVYAVAAAGCVVPLFIGVVTQALALSPGNAIAVLGAYALSVTLPLAGVTLLAGVGIDGWHRAGAYSGSITRIAGLVMVLAGLGQVYLAVFILGVL